MGKAGFLDSRILDESEFKNGRLDSPSPLAQPPKCPECGSVKNWKDGVRSTKYGEVQRYLCRGCGYRFSEPNVKVNVSNQSLKRLNPEPNFLDADITKRNFPVKERLDSLSFQRREDVASHISSKGTIIEKELNTFGDYNRERQVCVSEREAKNLSQQNTRQKQAAGATLDTKGYLVTYEAKMILKGLKPLTILRRISVLRLLMKRGANLLDPKSAFKAINHAKRYDHATQQLVEKEWSEGSKSNAAQAYKGFCETVGIQIPRDINFNKWSRRHQKILWIPLEIEIDSLIAGCSKKIAGFLQVIKETWCRAGEAWRLEWTDVDSERNIVTINEPEKDGLPRQFKASSKLIAMLNNLPKTNQRVFSSSTLKAIHQNFLKQRKRLAHKLQNPRLRRITFHTLRHWGATMEYHRTKDILHVKERLGHRDIESTLIYTHLVSFEGDEYHVKVAKTIEKDKELLKSGFKYVTERDGVKIYRKRK